MNENSEFDKRLEQFINLVNANEQLPSSLRNKETTGKRKDGSRFFLTDQFEGGPRMDPKNLNLLYSLLNSKNEDSIKYWRALSYYLIIRNTSNQITNNNFTFRQIMDLLTLVHQNHLSKLNDDSKELLEVTKDFISSNALLTSLTPTSMGSLIANEYSWINANDMFVVGIAKYSDEILDRVSMVYKLLLLEVLLEVNGISMIARKPDTPGLPTKSDIEILERLGLIVSSETIKDSFSTNDHDLDLSYTLNDAPEEEDGYKEDQNPSLAREIINPNFWFDELYEAGVDIDDLGLEYHWHQRHLKNMFSDFRRITFPEVLLISDRPEVSPQPPVEDRGSNTITMYDILGQFGIDEDYADDIYESIYYLEELLDAHMAANKVRGRSLGKKEIALLAGLKNERTVSNAISNGEIEKDEKGSLDHKSVIDWVSRKKKRTWRRSVISKMPIKDILEKL